MPAPDRRLLELLDSLEVVVPTGQRCAEPGGYSLVISDAGGTARSYWASADAVTCGPANTPYVASEPLRALLSPACLYSRRYDGSTLQSAPRIGVGDGCQHGLTSNATIGQFRRDAAAESPEWWLLADVKSAGLHRIAIHDCGKQRIRIELSAADGTLLASADPSIDPCTSLVHEITTAGTYTVFVESLSGASSSDFYLSVDRLASELDAGAGSESR